MLDDNFACHSSFAFGRFSAGGIRRLDGWGSSFGLVVGRGVSFLGLLIAAELSGLSTLKNPMARTRIKSMETVGHLPFFQYIFTCVFALANTTMDELGVGCWNLTAFVSKKSLLALAFSSFIKK